MAKYGLLVLAVAGCGTGSQDSATELAHGPRFLDDTPAWSAAGPLGACFGAAIEVADLDGDGRPELIAGDPPCLPIPPVAAGRIAIYRGAARYFDDPPTFSALDWQNPPRGGFQLSLASGDVDGDGHADLMIRSQAGVQVFAAIADPGVPLGAPLFRVPGTGAFGPAILADIDGDGLADLINVRASLATVWRATPGPQPFTAGRSITGVFGVTDAGDTDGDGRDDVIVLGAAGSRLFRGCAIGAPTCDGGLTIEPAWSTERRAYGMVPDLNGDDVAEALLGNSPFEAAGRVALHLSSQAGIDTTAVWSTLTDPGYPVLGQSVTVPGDLDGDRRATEFVLGAAGRMYAFFPSQRLDKLAPKFAWPRSNSVQAQLLGDGAVFSFGALAVRAPGDLDGDGFADLVVGNGPEIGSDQPGRVFVFGGGRLRPRTPGKAQPFLPGAQICTPEGDGRPDLTVDAEVLARTLHIEERAFAADSCEVAEGCVVGTGVRRLLRFTTSIANLGGSPVIIPGPDTAPHLYHFDACHDHFHLSDFARYELIDRRGHTLAVGRKQGFFLVDVAGYCTNDHPAASFFPDQGISAGWADVYESSLPCQWLDVTDVADGRYTLRVTADSLHLVDQDDQLSDTAEVEVVLDRDRVWVHQ